jgi:2-phospho-L-lactate guanylyltransferase
MRLWAVLPAKGFARAKSRLGEVLSDPVRSAFARGLFEHVLGTLQAAPSIRGILVLTDDDEVQALAEACGARVQRDRPDQLLAQIVDAGLLRTVELGAEAAIVCMADLPHVSVEEFEQAACALISSSVVLAPDAGEAGTNLLGLRPPALFPSCFGHGDSFRQHAERAENLGHRVALLRAPGLCFDVDGPQDLGELD